MRGLVLGFSLLSGHMHHKERKHEAFNVSIERTVTDGSARHQLALVRCL